jgi:uncharacterized membrane protein
MKSKSLGRSLIGYFLQGLLFLAPISITVYILYVLFVYVDGLLEKTISSFLGVSIPGIGIMVIFVGITIIGFLGSRIIFHPLMRYFEKLIGKAPFVRIIYSSIKDFFTAFVGQKKRFTEPVLVKINKDLDMQKIGFVTNRDLSLIGVGGGKVAVYLPHSFNFSGNLFIVSSENVCKINANPSDVMKFIISGGITQLEEKDTNGKDTTKNSCNK